jgi:chromosome segregation ATPase
MHEKAELEDKLQESEHRIIQLEGETETIGEYVALYQTQRMALKEKFTEKDKIIQQLLDDKRHLEIRLNEVQGLVKQLSDNRQFINGEDAWVEDKSHDQSHDHHQLNPVNQIVSRIEELTSTPLLIEGAVLQCPCCSGQLIIV